MDSESIVEQLVRNLSFEIETATQSNPIRLEDKSKSTPLNVKVRVRKKNESPQYGVISIPKAYTGNGKIHLANSDQTIMSFDFFVEPDLQRKPPKKHRRKLIEIIRQGTCLGSQKNDEDLCYLPSSSNKQTIKEQNITSKSDCLLKQPTTLSKRNYLNSSSSLTKNNIFLGKCKPGGCLDPPFSEDKYPYTPTTEKLFAPARKSLNTVQNIVKHTNSSIRVKTKQTDSSAVNISIRNDQKDTTNLILKLYEAGSVNTSMSTTNSNSVITYPPTLTSSECRIYNGYNKNSNVTTEINKNTVNQPYDSYFIPSKRALKRLERKKSEISSLSVKEDNYLNNNIPNNDLLDINTGQYKVGNSTHLGQPNYFNNKLDEDNVNSKIDSVNITQQNEKGTVSEVSYSQLQINDVQGSVLNDFLLTHDNHSNEQDKFLPYETKINQPKDISESNPKLKLKDIDLSKKSLQQILEPNNYYSSDTPNYLNTDVNSKILADSDDDVSMNTTVEDTTILNEILNNTKIVKNDFDENVHNVMKQLSNYQNTTKSKEISEPPSESELVKDISHNYSTSSMSLMSKTKVFYEQDLPQVLKASLESNELINPNDQNYHKYLSECLNTESKQNDEKSISLLSEKVTTSIQDSKSEEKNSLSPKHSIIDTKNLSINNNTKILAKHSPPSSISKHSIEIIPNITHSGSTHKTSVMENIDAAVEKPDGQVVTHISELSLYTEKERCLQDDSNMDILKATKNENSTRELSIKGYPSQKSDTEINHDEFQTINLKNNSIYSSVLIDITKESSSHKQSFMGEKGFNVEYILPARNDEKNGADMGSQQVECENSTFLSTPGKDEFLNLNSLSKSNSQLIYCDENFPLPVRQPHKVSGGIYKHNYSIEGSSRHYRIENTSVHEPVITNTSRIYADIELINKNSTLLADKTKDELAIEVNKNSKIYVASNTTTMDLQVRSIKLENEYLDMNKAKTTKKDLKIISRISNTQKKDISLDLAFQIFSNDKNQRFIRTHSSENEPERYIHGTMCKVKTEIRPSNYKLVIPIDSKNELSIHIDKVNECIELPRSTIIDKGTQVTEQIKSSNNESSNETVNDLKNDSLISICEKELMPLQMAIAGLKKEIDALAEQQLIFKSNLTGIKKMKLIRFSNAGKRCGCLKGYF